jgi:regulator of nucleoside diphosphate kinase
MSNKIIYITDRDHKRLQDLVKTAKEYNEEDKEYLNNLQNELDKATLIEEIRLPSGIVAMYSCVEIYDVSSKETLRYSIVFPEEADIDQQKISILSPLGTALIGEKEGTEIEIKLISGKRKFIINRVI